MNKAYKKEVEYSVEAVIDLLIGYKNPGVDKDTLETLCQDLDQREEAIEDILEYLDVESPRQ